MLKYNLRLEYTALYSDFCPDLQSGQVDASCRKPEPVCRFELSDFIENFVVCDGHRLRFLASMNPSCLRISEIRTHIAFIFMHLLVTIHVSLLCSE